MHQRSSTAFQSAQTLPIRCVGVNAHWLAILDVDCAVRGPTPVDHCLQCERFERIERKLNGDLVLHCSATPR